MFHPRNENHPYRLLRQEVMFLRNLHHPSIISMVGACVKPWALILELAPLGSLNTLLNSREALGRGIQHRIALQVESRYTSQIARQLKETSLLNDERQCQSKGGLVLIADISTNLEFRWLHWFKKITSLVLTVISL